MFLDRSLFGLSCKNTHTQTHTGTHTHTHTHRDSDEHSIVAFCTNRTITIIIIISGKVCSYHILLDRFFRQLTRRYSGGGPRSQPSRISSKAAFSGRPKAPCQGAARHPSISVWERVWALAGISAPPRIWVQGRFFWTPRGPPPARCSLRLHICLAARAGAGRYFGHPEQRSFLGHPGGPSQHAASHPSILVWQCAQLQSQVLGPLC